MKDGSITNAQITASSHSVDGEPFEARLDGDNAWIPWMMLSYVSRHTYLCPNLAFAEFDQGQLCHRVRKECLQSIIC